MRIFVAIGVILEHNVMLDVTRVNDNVELQYCSYSGRVLEKQKTSLKKVLVNQYVFIIYCYYISLQCPTQLPTKDSCRYYSSRV